jgi:hypothetical protein
LVGEAVGKAVGATNEADGPVVVAGPAEHAAAASTANDSQAQRTIEFTSHRL